MVVTLRAAAVFGLFSSIVGLAFAGCGSSENAAPSGAGATGGTASTGGSGGNGQGTGGATAGSAGTSGGVAGSANGGAGSGVRAAHKTKCTYPIAARMEYHDVYDPNATGDTTGEATSASPGLRHFRLGLGGHISPSATDRPDPSTSIAVAWESDLATTATTVQFGTSPDPTKWDENDVVDGLSYEVDPQKGAIDGTTVRIHETHLCGLSPKTTYYYRAGGGPAGSEVWSDVKSFTTLTSDPNDTITVAADGDSRGENGNAWQILEEHVKSRGDVQLQIFSGDLTDIGTSGTEYDSWLTHAETDTKGQPSVFGSVLTLIAMGNHENYSSNFFATVVQPDDPSVMGDFGELTFSFDFGPVHFIVLDDLAIGKNTMPALASGELAWLQEDLAAANANRNVRPWIVVSHHHGEWTSSTHKSDSDVLNVRAALAPIWDQFKVDLIINGHDHNYERSKPLTINPDQTPNVGAGTTYVVCAGAGADAYPNGSGPQTALSFDFSKDGALGVYSILTASKSMLKLEAHELTAAGDDPVKDTLTLTK